MLSRKVDLGRDWLAAIHDAGPERVASNQSVHPALLFAAIPLVHGLPPADAVSPVGKIILSKGEEVPPVCPTCPLSEWQAARIWRGRGSSSAISAVVVQAGRHEIDQGAFSAEQLQRPGLVPCLHLPPGVWLAAQAAGAAAPLREDWGGDGGFSGGEGVRAESTARFVRQFPREGYSPTCPSLTAPRFCEARRSVRKSDPVCSATCGAPRRSLLPGC